MYSKLHSALAIEMMHSSLPNDKP